MTQQAAENSSIERDEESLGADGLCQRKTHNNMSILPLFLTTTIFVCPHSLP